MLLGLTVADPEGVEGSTEGLGLLPIQTIMRPEKITTRTLVRFPEMPQPWSALTGVVAPGYQIRNGRVEGDECRLEENLWMEGPVMATTVHGLLEDPVTLEAITGFRPRAVLEDTFELLADAVDAHLDVGFLTRLVT